MLVVVVAAAAPKTTPMPTTRALLVGTLESLKALQFPKAAKKHVFDF